MADGWRDGRLDGRFTVVARHRPIDLVAPDGVGLGGVDGTVGARAPYLAVEATRVGPGRAELSLEGKGLTLTASYDDQVTVRVTAGARTTTHRSRRFGRLPRPGAARVLALVLTGPQVTALTREDGVWVARARVDLGSHPVVRDGAPSPHDPAWSASVQARAHGPVERVRSGRFGQLGLRDVRVVSRADGTPCREGHRVLLTATSAGPGGFATGHASVWSLDPDTLDLRHRADLFVRRPGGVRGEPGVYGDHAVHLVRDEGRWLLAASTWGDFDPHRRPVRVVLAESTADLTRGAHVLDARPLDLPTDGLASVGVWDPHLVRREDGWRVGFVSATRYFRFHPALAAGPTLDTLTLRAADPSRREAEGTTVVPTGDGWRVLASDKHARSYPVYDESLREVGRLDAAYPSNIPWPTLVPAGDRTLLVGFDGRRAGGDLVGYGSHGDLVVQAAPVSR